MILFFHFICLLARYIVSNISKSFNTGKLFWDDEAPDYCGDDQFSEYLKEKVGHVKYPIYEDDTLKFFPPVYVQRYETVAFILEDAAQRYKIKKVADFGCAELGFLMYLKYIDGVTEILEVDIDSEVLEQYSFKAAPLTSDYLIGKWKKPLDVYILAGSIADYDDHLIGCDALVAIELIEHLSEEAFEKMPYNVFYKIKPKIAIFTTPNADFNSLFPNFSDLRHEDHKFEWTRKEFYDWTQLVLKIYPEYSVRFYGIGAGPEGTENLGCCTQMAVFVRCDDSEYFLSARGENEEVHNYQLIQHFNYPFYVDSRTVEEKIIHEVQYQVAHLSTLETYYNYETNESEIPVALLKDFVIDLCPSDEQFLEILRKNGMTLKEKDNTWFLVCPEIESFPSDTTSKCDDWLNDDIPGDFYDNDLLLNDKSWDDDEQLCSEAAQNFHSAKNSRQLESLSPDVDQILDKELIVTSKEKIKSAPHSCNHLIPDKNSPRVLINVEFNSEKCKKLTPVKSRIPRIKNERYDKMSSTSDRETSLVCEHFKQISKACSLDSCLENINCKPFERKSYYLNLMSGDFKSPNVSDILLSPGKRAHMKNSSGSSLLSISLDKAGDSGYPFSFSTPDDNLTPEQVDELFTENEMMSRSTSSSSEVNVIDVNYRLQHDLFIEEIPVENGDVANNNRDWEGNNVEGLRGQRLVNDVAVERDPNDNLFFPEAEEFPPWLLNLGELALRPVYFPLHDSDSHESVGDNSSGRFSYSPDVEDIDFDLRKP